MTSTTGSRAAITHELLATGGEDLPLTVARRAGTGAAVAVMPSAFGVGPDLEEQMAEMAETASVVVAFDPFFRDDPGPAPYDDMARVMARIRSLEPERAYRFLTEAIGRASREAGGRPVVVLGLCFGAPYALRAAADGLASALVSWHGTGIERSLERAAEMRCPMRLHFGGADPFVPPAAVEAVRAAFAGRGEVRVVVHEGATHGFSHRASSRSYDERAERESLRSVVELSRG